MPTRRELLIGAAGGATVLLSSGLPLGAAAYAAVPTDATQPRLADEVAAFTEYLQSKFVDPDRVYSSDVRWWLGDASHTDETLLEEVQALYDGGFRGVELAMQNDAGAPDAVYAYGSEMWAHKWNLMMNKLLDLGMSVYLTSGTNWATSNVPGLDPDSQAAMQNVTQATSTVNAGQTLTALPAPAANARRAGAPVLDVVRGHGRGVPQAEGLRHHALAVPHPGSQGARLQPLSLGRRDRDVPAGRPGEPSPGHRQ